MKPNLYNQVLNAMAKAKSDALPHLDKQANFILSLDKRLDNLELLKKKLEAEKQESLKAMEDLMEAVPVLIHSLPNGYTIAYDHKRKMQIDNMTSFLRWLKAHCQPHEVLSFFDGALKSASIKAFVEKKCDEQRCEGILDPKIDGIDLQEITFRRLTTFYKVKK